MTGQPPDPPFSVRYARTVVRWRWPVLLVTLALGIAAAAGAARLRFVDEYRVFFGPDNPQLLAFDAIENIYTKNDNILFVVAPPGGNAFTNATLAIVEDLTAEAWKIPFAIRVDSLSNFQHTRADGDELVVGDLVRNAASLGEAEIAGIREVALAEPLLRHRLVPPDTEVVGLNVTLQLPRKELDETARAVAHARALAREVERAHPGHRVHLTGQVILNNAFQEAAMRDMQTLTPLMYGVIVLALIALLRSLTATVSTLTVVGFSVAGALGLAGWAGMALTPPSTAAATMIMTLGVADGIHIMATLLKEMRRGSRRHDALVESLRVNMQPVFLTSLTTVIGFLSMNFSEVPPLKDLGNISATGVAIAWLLSITLLPAMAAILPIAVRARATSRSAPMDRVADFVVARQRPLLWGGTAAAVLLTALMPLNALNDQFVRYFDESTTFRQDADFATEHLSGPYQIEFSLSAGDSGGISNPAYLATLDEFAAWYRQQPGVVHVATVSDVFHRLNKNMHGDDPRQYRLPRDRELAAQYLLLYEMSLPHGLDLNNQINVDKSATRLSVTLDDVTTRELVALVERGEQWLRDHAPASMATRGAGPGVMFAYISARNIRSMLWGTLLAMLLIGGTLMLALRSVRYGLISFVPNLLPASMAFGVWGALVGEINLGLSIVTGMCLGIVVDDTVHFLSKYLRARREHDLEPDQAVRYAFSTVGAAIVVTSIVLAAGFLVLAQSTFGFNGGMGRLSAIIIAFALAGDLLLLPPLLLQFDRRTSGGATHHSREGFRNAYATVN
jgi:predicted RND superfamily exporter protein